MPGTNRSKRRKTNALEQIREEKSKTNTIRKKCAGTNTKKVMRGKDNFSSKDIYGRRTGKWDDKNKRQHIMNQPTIKSNWNKLKQKMDDAYSKDEQKIKDYRKFKNKKTGIYSLVRLVWLNTEMLISRPFMDSWKIRLLLQDCISSKNVRN